MWMPCSPKGSQRPLRGLAGAPGGARALGPCHTLRASMPLPAGRPCQTQKGMLRQDPGLRRRQAKEPQPKRIGTLAPSASEPRTPQVGSPGCFAGSRPRPTQPFGQPRHPRAQSSSCGGQLPKSWAFGIGAALARRSASGLPPTAFTRGGSSSLQWEPLGAKIPEGLSPASLGDRGSPLWVRVTPASSGSTCLLRTPTPSAAERDGNALQGGANQFAQ